MNRADELPDTAPRAAQWVGRPGDLSAARQLVADIGRSEGLAQQRCADLAVAVSGIVTNAIQHGGGCATILTYADSDTITVDIHDRSNTAIPPPPRGPPPATDLRGRGLWLAAQLCDRVEINRLRAGNFVRLVMTL
jgi:anti-sigma regulatory factor (Ser/Thr protein kinase)